MQFLLIVTVIIMTWSGVHAQDAPSEIPECVYPAAPKIVINAESPRITYDYSKNTEQLNAAFMASGNSLGTGARVQGMYTSPVKQMRIESTFRAQDTLDGMQRCLYYDTIIVTINIQPTIYMNRDVRHAKCRLEVKKHEIQHNDVHKEIINKYSYVIGKSLQDTVNEIGPVGPIPIAHSNETQQKMLMRVKNAALAHSSVMYREYEARQRQVDSPYEYNRIDQICQKYER